jgi:cardiolipin synthase
MVTALITAALRGVEITLVLPRQNNLPFAAWASRASYWELLKNGIKIYEQPPPFAHTKLFQVDDLWSLIGSANWDTRSFRLNFELNLSVFDQQFSEAVNRHFDEVLAVSRDVSAEEMDSRNLLERLRDCGARLFTPYL